jgi:hypothetical protein
MLSGPGRRPADARRDGEGGQRRVSPSRRERAAVRAVRRAGRRRRGRLLSRAALVPLSHIADDRLTAEERDRLSAARVGVESAPLTVFAGRHAADYWTSEHAQSRVTESAALFDDPDWEGAWELRRARRLADSGWAVVVSVPRPRVLDGPAHRSDLHDEIALADIVIEVRVSNLDAVEAYPRVEEPGYAALTVLRNRRGPLSSSSRVTTPALSTRPRPGGSTGILPDAPPAACRRRTSTVRQPDARADTCGTGRGSRFHDWFGLTPRHIHAKMSSSRTGVSSPGRDVASSRHAKASGCVRMSAPIATVMAVM